MLYFKQNIYNLPNKVAIYVLHTFHLIYLFFIKQFVQRGGGNLSYSSISEAAVVVETPLSARTSTTINMLLILIDIR